MSKPILNRTNSASVRLKILEEIQAIPQCQSYKYTGDPVDGIPFKQSNYSTSPRVCKVPISREASRSNLSADDSTDAPESQTPDPKDLELGFDLISLTSRRGHFVDKVRPNSKAEGAGLKHGDLLLEVNGVMVRDFSHDDLVTLIRQNSIDAFGANSDDFDGVMFKVISQPEAEKTPKSEMTVMEEEIAVNDVTKEEKS